MRILIAHSRYLQRGGEDQVVDAEAGLLRKHGDEVLMYEEHNDTIRGMSRPQLAIETIWSRRSADKFTKIAVEFKPDVLHVHNTFPLISPAIYWKASSLGIPVVQTLHNYRLICPQAMLLRDNRVCEECVSRSPWRSVRHACYRNSRIQTGVIAAMIVTHQLLHTFADKISAYIALTGFSRDKFIEGGLPGNRIHVKPNFVDIEPTPRTVGTNGLFVGRLYEEKGIRTLGAVLEQLPSVQLDVIGAGPMNTVIEKLPNCTLLGWKTPGEVHAAMRGAAYLVVPSIWYETFGLIVIEAYACGLPVIASRIGALAELVQEGGTGLLVEPGSTEDLADKIRWAESHPEEMAAMGERGREIYQDNYTSDQNYRMLMAIYKEISAD